MAAGIFPACIPFMSSSSSSSSVTFDLALDSDLPLFLSGSDWALCRPLDDDDTGGSFLEVGRADLGTQGRVAVFGVFTSLTDSA